MLTFSMRAIPGSWYVVSILADRWTEETSCNSVQHTTTTDSKTPIRQGRPEDTIYISTFISTVPSFRWHTHIPSLHIAGE